MPAPYQALWAVGETCTGLRGNFGALRFYSTPGETTDGTHAAMTYGATIYIAERWTEIPLVVKHEMIHALGIHGYLAGPFEEPCHATYTTWRDE